MKINKRISLKFALAATLVMSCVYVSTEAQATQVIKLGWATADGPTDPYAIGGRAFKEEVEKASNGTIEFQLYSNRQLGDEKQMLEAIRFGTLDAAVITNSVIAQIDPAFQVNDLPFLFEDSTQARRVLDGAVGTTLAEKLAKKNIILLGYMEGGFRQTINNTRPITEPSDLKGVKLRVMQNPMFIELFSVLGGGGIPMAWSETFTAVQQGTIDGLEVPLAVIDSTKMYEVTKYLSLTNHTYSMIALLMSKRTFEKLTPEQQKILKEAAQVATAVQRETVAANEQTLLAGLENKGMTVNKLPDTAPFRQAVQPIYAKAEKSVGKDWLKQVLETLN
jgi:tripartite ATP-independent transporter DctP family solute receptor